MASSSVASERIGFIGVGLMGRGMAKNIVEKGYPLTILGRANRAPVEDLTQRGAIEVKTASEVASRSTVVFLCVTGSKEVEAIVRGADGLKQGLRPGSVVVDCSTADPNSTIALAAELAPLGVDYVDAPLSRTPKEAWEGKLDTMVGASEAVFARLKPILDTWAGRAVHIGGVGDGHRMKLLNNFLALGYAALYSEALALSQKVGISPQRFDSVIRGCAHGLRLLSDLHALDAGGRPRRAQVHHRQRLQGSALPRSDGRRGWPRQSHGQRRQERLRAGRRGGRRAGLRADAGDPYRPRQRRRPDAGQGISRPRRRAGQPRSSSALAEAAASRRRAERWSLPLGVFGSSARNSIARGYL